MRLLYACLALLVFPLPAAHAGEFNSSPWYDTEIYPASSRPGLHAVERLGATFGGNAVSKITYPNGAIQEISAGGLYQIGLGVLYQAEVIPVSVALTLNYHYNADYNNNDNAAFRRNPVEALFYFNGPGNFRIGGGMRYVYSARVNSTLNGVTEKITYKNTRGSIVEIGYQVRPYGWVNLRYVRETYRVATYTTSGTSPALAEDTPYNGSHVGLFISYEY